jgi:hypothetical protein
MNRCLLPIFMLMFAAPLLAKNNDWPKVKKDCEEVFSPTSPAPGAPSAPLWKRSMGCGVDFFTARPVHLTIKSIVPGGGFGPGLTSHIDLNSDRWQRYVEATGVASFQGFWEGDGKFSATHQRFGANNSARDRFAFEAYSFARGLPRMDFYGIGPNTLKSNVTDFAERDIVAGADVFNPFSGWLAAGARLEGIWPQVNGISDPKRRSITTLFNENTAPGLSAQPAFVHYEGYVEPRRTRHKFQFKYDVGYGFYQDTDTGHFSFRRFFVEGTHPFHPFAGRPDDVLTIHDRLSISQTSDGNAVPFYLQETLGGSNINGQPTLRGFADYRFRGPDLLLFQVEYDHRFWGPLGGLAFYDTGQVANLASDLDLARMRHSFGFGISLWAGEKQWFKIYVGLGSGEGVHPYFGIPKF